MKSLFLVSLLALSISSVSAEGFKPTLTGCKYQTVSDFKFSTAKPVKIATCYIKLPEAGPLRNIHTASAIKNKFGIMAYSVRRKNSKTLDFKIHNKLASAVARYRIIGIN